MPPKDLKQTQFYMETESGERIEVSGISDITIETEDVQTGGYTQSFIGKESEIEFELDEDGKKQAEELFKPFIKAAENMINLLRRTYLCNNWRKMHGLPLIRRRGRK